MSQRNKRLNKKLSSLSENYERETELNNLIEVYSRIIKELNDEVDNLWDEYDSIMSYIYKKEDASISYDLLEMPDGRVLNVIILETENEIAVAHKGLVGKAKRHENDAFDFEIGYSIAATRLMMKILQKEYEF